MTLEEKITKMYTLLELAVSNGWEDTTNGCYTLVDNNRLWNHDGNDYEYYSLDSLIGNFEKDKVRFIEALYNHCSTLSNFEKWRYSFHQYNDDEIGQTDSIIIHWFRLPSSERLEWLFKIFEHLLN
jgi:hypothetical protein